MAVKTKAGHHLGQELGKARGQRSGQDSKGPSENRLGGAGSIEDRQGRGVRQGKAKVSVSAVSQGYERSGPGLSGKTQLGLR